MARHDTAPACGSHQSLVVSRSAAPTERVWHATHVRFLNPSKCPMRFGIQFLSGPQRRPSAREMLVERSDILRAGLKAHRHPHELVAPVGTARPFGRLLE